MCIIRSNQRFHARVAEIDELHAQGIEEIERSFESELEEIEKLSEHEIEVEPRAHNEPVEPVALRPELSALVSKCDEIRRAALDTHDEGLAGLWGECTRRHSDLFVSALVGEYWAADVDWISKELDQHPEELDLESLFVYSHNLRIRAHMSERRRRARTERANALRDLGRLRDQAVAVADEVRDLEIAESRQRFASAVSAAAQAMAASRQSTAATPPMIYGGAPRAAGACTSDFSCGIGWRCVKNNFAGHGFCARAVDAYGGPTFELPRTESVMIKVPDDADCTFDTDCPVGFRCDAKSGACLR